MSILRVGLLGLGEVAQSIHIPVLRDQRDRWLLVGVYDVSPSVVDLICSQNPTARAFETAEALIQSPDIDVVFILSPDETHRPYLLKAIKADKHVLLEKPACLTLREMDDVIAQAEGYAKTIFVGYMRRYASAYLKARDALPPTQDITHARIFDLISEGPHFLSKSWNILYPDDIPAETRAAGAAARDALIREVVGQDAPDDLVRAYRGLTALSSHHISAMRGLLGEPNGVLYADRTNGGANTTVAFDYGHYVVNYDAVVDDLGVFDAMIEVLSNTKRIRIVYDTPYIRNLPTRLEITEASPDGPVHHVYAPIYADAFSNELIAFHDHIRNGTRPLTDLRDSRRDLALMSAAIDKMKTVRPA